MKALLITLLFFISFNAVQSQVLVNRSFKLKSYWNDQHFGLKKNDILSIKFKENEGKSIKQFQIVKYPDQIIFERYKVNEVDETININETGIYKLVIYGSNQRVCDIKLERHSDEVNDGFSSEIEWVSKNDTTFREVSEWQTLGYDTIIHQKTRWNVIKVDTSREILKNRTELISSQVRVDGTNQNRIDIRLPRNTNTKEVKREIQSWLYWISVGQEGQKAWNQNVKEISNLGTKYLSIIDPLYALGTGVVGTLVSTTTDENVSFKFVTSLNGKSVILDNGNSTVAYGKMEYPKQGGFTLLLENENYFQGIQVDVKIIAIIETTYFEIEYYDEIEIKENREYIKVRKPYVKEIEFPVLKQSITH